MGDAGMLYGTLIFEEAIELVDRLLTEQDASLLADVMEHVVDKSDRAHAVLMLLTMRARGIDMPTTGAAIANTTPSAADLILPPGVEVHRG